jgi:hypothetical protein
MQYPRFAFWQGTTITFQGKVRQTSVPDSPPVDLTNATAICLIKSSINDADESALIRYVVGNGITLTDPVNGIFQIVMKGADTEFISVVGRRRCYMQVAIHAPNDFLIRSSVVQLEIYQGTIKATP